MIDLQLLADKKGIARTYYDVTNQLTYIPEKCRIDALEVLGYPVDDRKALDEKIMKEEIAPFHNILDYVTVINDKDYAQFYIRTPEALGDDEQAMVIVSLNLEDGRTVERSVPLEEIEIADFVSIQNEHYDIRRYRILSNLPLGYHHCTVQIKSGNKVLNSIPMSLIVCPSRMYAPQEIEKGCKVWGVSSQLYAVRSKNNWGIGDFDDLRDLLLRVHHSGGQFVGLNPLHAGYF